MSGYGPRARYRGSPRLRHRRAPDRLACYRRRAAAVGRSSVRWPARPSDARARRRSPHRENGPSFDTLDKDLDLAAASQSDLPGLLVGDPEIEEARLAVADRVERLADDRTL